MAEGTWDRAGSDPGDASSTSREPELGRGTNRMLEHLRQGTDTFLTTKLDAVLNWGR